MVVDNKAKITYVQVLKEDLAIFHITPETGPIPDFKAGQFVTLGLHVPSEGKIIRRAYSIASPPEQKKRFELVIRWVRKPVPGRLTTELFNKKEGDGPDWRRNRSCPVCFLFNAPKVNWQQARNNRAAWSQLC
jgi:ferredoxin--NADP+ reductase